MGTNAVRRDATAETVSANVKRVRTDKNLGLRALSKKLGEVGRPLGHSAVDQIEKGTRRVDVDDLMALAAAFNVSPIALLMPESATRDDLVEVTGRPPERAERVWDRLRALHLPDDVDFWVGSNPPWALGNVIAVGLTASGEVGRGND
jgi:transcriptional regulator with XRE-family HTH domain